MATNVDRDLIESISVNLVNKTVIFNKPTPQGLESYFIVSIKENSEVKNSTFAYENVNWNSNNTSDSRSKENNPDKIHADNIDLTFGFCK